MRVVYTNENGISNMLEYCQRDPSLFPVRLVEMSDDDIRLLADAKTYLARWHTTSLTECVEKYIELGQTHAIALNKQDADKAYADGLKTGEHIGVEKQKTVQLADHAQQMAREYNRGHRDGLARRRKIDIAPLLDAEYNRGKADGFIASQSVPALDKAYNDGMQAGIIAERQRIVDLIEKQVKYCDDHGQAGNRGGWLTDCDELIQLISK